MNAKLLLSKPSKRLLSGFIALKRPVRYPPNVGRSESGDRRLKAAAAAIMGLAVIITAASPWLRRYHA